jgi:hypothetical protein
MPGDTFAGKMTEARIPAPIIINPSSTPAHLT